MDERKDGRIPNEGQEPNKTINHRFADTVRFLSTQIRPGHKLLVRPFQMDGNLELDTKEIYINNSLPNFEVAVVYNDSVPLFTVLFQQKTAPLNDRKTTFFVLAEDDKDPRFHKIRKFNDSFINLTLDSIADYDEWALDKIRSAEEKMIQDEFRRQIGEIGDIPSDEKPKMLAVDDYEAEKVIEVLRIITSDDSDRNLGRAEDLIREFVLAA